MRRGNLLLSIINVHKIKIKTFFIKKKNYVILDEKTFSITTSLKLFVYEHNLWLKSLLSIWQIPGQEFYV